MKWSPCRFMLALLMLVLPACAAIKPPADPALMLPIQGQWTIGEAAWYGELYHGRKTTSGDFFDLNLLTGAHSTIPLGATVEVRNIESGKTVSILLNDRSNDARQVDLLISKAAAHELGLIEERRFWVEYRWVQ